MSCEHQKFCVTETDIVTAYHPQKNETVYIACVTISCRNCGVKFQFKGAKKDLSLDEPTVSQDGLQIQCPMEPLDRSVFDIAEPKDN